MSLILTLPGRRALSEFRLNKLLQQATHHLPRLTGIDTQYWHFVKLARTLSGEEMATLHALLTYGAAPVAGLGGHDEAAGERLLVVPRLGTISPWASKATDIARQCGLMAVERIERGTAYWLRGVRVSALRTAQRRALLPLLHDRM